VQKLSVAIVFEAHFGSRRPLDCFIHLSSPSGISALASTKELLRQRRILTELTRRGSWHRGVSLLVSGIINILALTGSLYMMQIYDRADGSGSVPRLVGAAGAVAIGLYIFQGCFDVFAHRFW